MATVVLSNGNFRVQVTYTCSNGTFTLTELQGCRTDGYTSYRNADTSVTVSVAGTSKSVSLSSCVYFTKNSSYTTWGATDTAWSVSTDSTSVSITVTMPSSSAAYGSMAFSGTATQTLSSYTVTFALEGGTRTGGGALTQTVSYGESATVPTVSRTGYTFAGWSGTYTGVTSDRTITATWNVNYYYLNLNGMLDGSSSGSISGYGTADVYINGSLVSNNVADFYTQYPYGTTYSISDIKATTGHTYNGVYSGSTSGTITGTTSVSLKFTTNTYTITYNANGGSGAPSSQSYTYSTSGSITLSGTKPIKEGYIFLGWSTSSTATSATYSSGGTFSKSVASNTTLYAVYVLNSYIITYDANKGQGEPAAQSKVSGTALTLSSTKPTRERHTFLGWSTSKTATSATYSAGGSFTTDADTTLYAVWRLDDDSILIYEDGTLEAINFIEVDSVTDNAFFVVGGIVYATEFIEHDEASVIIQEDGIIYAKSFKEC